MVFIQAILPKYRHCNPWMFSFTNSPNSNSNIQGYWGLRNILTQNCWEAKAYSPRVGVRGISYNKPPWSFYSPRDTPSYLDWTAKICLTGYYFQIVWSGISQESLFISSHCGKLGCIISQIKATKQTNKQWPVSALYFQGIWDQSNHNINHLLLIWVVFITAQL